MVLTEKVRPQKRLLDRAVDIDADGHSGGRWASHPVLQHVVVAAVASSRDCRRCRGSPPEAPFAI